jgi:hypothetical protein
MLDKIFIGEIPVGLFGVKKGEAISLEIKIYQSVDFTPRSLSVQDETTAGHFGITSDSLSQVERIRHMPRIRVEKNEYLGLAVEYTSVLEAVIAADDLRIPSVDVHTQVWVEFTAQLSSSAPPAYVAHRANPPQVPLASPQKGSGEPRLAEYEERRDLEHRKAGPEGRHDPVLEESPTRREAAFGGQGA